ncbi:glucose transporter [Mammaliicoccus sciuri]|uniref:GRP family sugar transporter n=1 Tax=Mammaliicoccus sciuri TaxID=1296 RepID=UPI000D1FB2E1|nr:GRP family sugar transporter [Mammaliicoccus sciuri]MCD8789850.1 GRP family sugar transporter [Mammaliicoccus sciuri]MCJ0917661.1 GRP family sugar transporter [Mammaliicoccus sciuri]MCJ0938306.1 GRP family sugar transporter [Mammaliicoccus sciuri]MEB6232199.1 GRP family sugar transporter [Mammaliicoccus sciuri]MEB6248510.1 GRP family sugar transporter [Mammaliicoccus sciuri]
MEYLIALLPALFWGSVVLINVKVGGGPYNQILGTTIGAFIIGLCLFFFGDVHFTFTTVIIGMISGAFWALGQGFQLRSVDLIGVSITMPISTGLQLLGTTLFSAAFLGEWSTGMQVALGLSGLVLLIIGVIFTSVQKKGSGNSGNTKKLGKAIPILLISTVGYVVYVVIGQVFGVEGWDALFPQSIGMVIGGIILSFKHKPTVKHTSLNLLPGIVWALGNMFLFISQPKVGVGTSFSFSQMLVIVSTLGGIYLLGEQKTKRQMTFIWIGIVLIIIAAFIIGAAKG